MHRSTDRILTTHAGSLPRPGDLLELIQAKATGRPYDQEAFAAREAFIPAISPTSIEDWQRNAYYKTEEEYLAAIAEAMHEEYKAIVDAGFLVQIDDPHLATHYVSRPELSVDQVRRWAEVRVEALNHALRGLPRDRIRWHTCYGINIGPRVHDLE